MTYQEDSKYINKAVTLLVTKDDCAAVCDVHIPLVESLEIGVVSGDPDPRAIGDSDRLRDVRGSCISGEPRIMTDPKPETPATDALVDEWRNISAAAKEQHRESAICSDRWITLSIRMTQLDAFTARIAADAETIRKQAEEIARLENRSGCEHCSDRRRVAEAELATAREEIERLKGREKVRAFAKLHDPTECHDYDCDRCHT